MAVEVDGEQRANRRVGAQGLVRPVEIEAARLVDVGPDRLRPARMIARVVANAVSGVVSTRAPGPTPAQRSAISSASSPLATPTA